MSYIAVLMDGSRPHREVPINDDADTPPRTLRLPAELNGVAKVAVYGLASTCDFPYAEYVLERYEDQDAIADLP
ncbi:hypothetical protein [Leifsonia soli]|uniref:Uncharacterized protein n=1 Tax=Leifsonia soli TaxID=582665 RepID=A0A852T5B8_9MICO|nr:hypothetical protein [Leifsonia soli]NYD76042.1 hypothetical protein [Leifsonia soli]